MSSGAMISTSPYKRQNLGVHNQMPTLVSSDGLISSKPRSRNISANSTPSRAGSTPPSRQGNKASKSSKSNKSRSENSPSASVSSSRAPPSSSSVQVETSVDHDSPQASSQTSSQKSHKKSHTKRRSQSLQQSTALPKSSAKAKLKVQRSVDEYSTSSNPNLMNGEHEISEMRENNKQIPKAETESIVTSQSKSLIAHPIKSSTTSNQPSSHMIEQTNHVITNDVEYHNTSHNNMMSRGDGISESMENTQQIADVDSHEHKELLYNLDLSKTEDRLKTLKWWPLASLTREELASNGYFYLGNEDRTQCYFCKIVVRNWGENADVSQYHHDNCTMKQDQQETNQQATTTTTRAIQQPATEDTPTETPPTSRIEQASSENTTAVTSPQQQATTTRIIQQASTEDTPTETPPTRTTTQPQQQASAQVSQVSEEEESENNYVTNVMTSSTSRMMQCHDDTDDEDEVLIDEDIEITPNEDPDIAEMNRDIYPCESPAVAAMKKLDARSDSFAHEEWQGDEMYFTSVAESGFFYLGSSDIVRCWYCGVHLTNWYWEGVDSWKCHATANHACEYLKRNRSSQFIEHAINNPEPTPAQLQEEEAQQRATTSTEVERIIPLVFSRSAPLPEYVPDTRPKEVQDREEFEGAMEKEPVKEALSMGYEREEIELVLKLQITQHGVAYQSYEGLLAAILDHRDVHH